MDDDELLVPSHSNVNVVVKPEVKLKKPPVVKFPHRAPSLVIPEKRPVYITPDKTTCAECPCFPKESPYRRRPKLRSCQQTPLTLYELAAAVVDSTPLPDAFKWTESDVVKWLSEVVGLPQYKECIFKNHINGMRLPLLEDPTVLERMNVVIFDHVMTIVTHVKKLFSLDFLKFTRSIGLPPRKPLTHCTWFKSRTGPNWGIRQNWTRCDILRWMKILGPAPVHRNHWDAVWYQPPDFPRTLFARIPPAETEKIPLYNFNPEPCDEYMAPRKFRLDQTDPDEVQLIWMARQDFAPVTLEDETLAGGRGRKIRKTLLPKKISLKGLKGKDLLLARRLMPKTKFMKC